MVLPARNASRGQAREVRLAAVAVCLVAVLGGGLRAVRAHAYLPWSHHSDEVGIDVPVGERMVRSGNTVPEVFIYPSLVYLAQAAVLVPAVALGAYEPDNPDDTVLREQTLGNAQANHPRLLEAMRWATGVLPGMIMAVVCGATAWVITRRWWSATFASGLAAISAVDLKFGPFVTPDALTGATVSLAILAAVLLSRRPSWLHYLLAGAAVGLAAAAKYNAGLVVIAVIAADWIAYGRPLGAPRKALGAGGAALAVFTLINHALVLQPRGLVDGIAWTSRAYRSSNYHHHEGGALLFNTATLWWTFGLALGVAALAVWGRDRGFRHSVLLIGSFSGVYLLFLSSFPARFARNLLALTPALAVLAAIGLVVIVDRARAHGPRLGLGIGIAASLLALAVPVRTAVGVMRELQDDPWSQAQVWLGENAPRGASIAVEHRGPYIDPDRYHVTPVVYNGLDMLRPDVDFYVGNRFPDQPDAPGCKVFEVPAVWEGEQKRIMITKPSPC